MNKKFWMLIVTGAVLAAGVTATGCAAQRRIDPTIAPTGTAIETTAEAETQPSQEETAPAGQKILVNENAFADENTTGNQAETDDGEKIAIPPFKTTKKAAKKTPSKTVTKTSKKTSNKSTVDPRALIVKMARAEAEKAATKYQNMGEKIAAAKQTAAKKTAAQKNVDARKDMNKAAQDAQNAAKEMRLTYINVDPSGSATFLKDDVLKLPGVDDKGDKVGGWAYAESTEITADIKKVVEKATETLTGATYEPIAYIGSQVVAGTNHAILCKSTPSVAELNGATTYVLIYVYEDLQGNCEITETTDVVLSID